MRQFPGSVVYVHWEMGKGSWGSVWKGGDI